jgi:hypothetical protein
VPSDLTIFLIFFWSYPVVTAADLPVHRVCFFDCLQSSQINAPPTGNRPDQAENKNVADIVASYAFPRFRGRYNGPSLRGHERVSCHDGFPNEFALFVNRKVRD